jgi:hypothetical protein
MYHMCVTATYACVCYVHLFLISWWLCFLLKRLQRPGSACVCVCVCVCVSCCKDSEGFEVPSIAKQQVGSKMRQVCWKVIQLFPMHIEQATKTSFRCLYTPLYVAYVTLLSGHFLSSRWCIYGVRQVGANGLAKNCRLSKRLFGV